VKTVKKTQSLSGKNKNNNREDAKPQRREKNNKLQAPNHK